MLYFPRWLVTLILGICALGVILSIPNVFSAQAVEKWPNFLPKKQVSLGLDLRGGSYLLYEVDMKSVLKEHLNNAADSLRTEFRNAKPPIGYTGLNADNNQVSFTLREPDRAEEVRTIVRRVDPQVDVTVGAGGAVSLKFNEVALKRLQQQIVEQSIEIVRRRIDETGTKEPSIQREGDDRIVLELPGVEDPEFVKRILGKTAKMTFQLVDVNANPEDAKRGHLPPGDEVLPLDD